MKYAIAPVLLLAALTFGQSWVVEQVDSTAASGSPVELVKAADGKLWAGYKTRSGAARVACLTDSGWSFTDVCAMAKLPSTHYRPFLAASPHGELCLACWDSTTDTNRLYRMVNDTWYSEPNPYNDSNPCNMVAYDSSGRLYTLFEPWTADFWLGHETDSGWTASYVVSLPAYGYEFLFDVGYLTAAADGSPWFFGFSGWDDSPYHGEYETDLLHFSGGTWASVWDVYGWPDWPPIPIALAPHGDGVGNLTYYNDFIQYDSESITTVGSGVYYPPVAGLAYTADDVPLVACAPSYWAARPLFAFKTNRWHIESIPGPAGYRGVDIETDTAGQVFVVFSTQDSGLWCAKARVSDVVGVKESPEPQASGPKPLPTIVRGILYLPRAENGDSPSERLRPTRRGTVPILRAALLDVSSRKVLALRPARMM